MHRHPTLIFGKVQIRTRYFCLHQLLRMKKTLILRLVRRENWVANRKTEIFTLSSKLQVLKSKLVNFGTLIARRETPCSKKQVRGGGASFFSHKLFAGSAANGRRRIEGSISLSLSLANTLVKDDVNTRKKAALNLSSVRQPPDLDTHSKYYTLVFQTLPA